jgi:chromosome partitioning protein
VRAAATLQRFRPFKGFCCAGRSGLICFSLSAAPRRQNSNNMSVIAVLNRKGGSGKTTLATHLAGHFARQQVPVMLGDVDRQKSAQVWLKLRAEHGATEYPQILGWAVDPRNVLRAPVGVQHIVLDTPGGLNGFDLARVVAFADVIVMPVCNSVFDRESSAEFHADLMALPRVASGRCKVAAVGMRVDASGADAEMLEAWAQRNHIAYAGSLRHTPAYVHCVERGLTLFDFPPDRVMTDMAQWKLILDWLRPLLQVRQGGASVLPAGAGTRSYEPGRANTERDASPVPIGATRPGAVVARHDAPTIPMQRPVIAAPSQAPTRVAPTSTARSVAAEPAPRSLLSSVFGRLFETLPTSRGLPGDA